MEKKGKVIVIEGVDGAGKTTQIERLKEFFHQAGMMNRFLFTKEPGGSPAGKEMRKIILKEKLDVKSEALLFYASRNELIQKEILPELEKGKHIIIDRFELSTFAYQIYGREQFHLRDFIYSLSDEIVPKDFVDLYIFLDLDVSVSKERESRREGESTRFDREGIEFFQRVREGYKRELDHYPHVILDASRSIDEIFEDIKGIVLSLFD